jgi:mannose-6-phosphate isomerase-like protein (cupin superfamily)
MQIVQLDTLTSFITADGSSIRELAHPSWTGAAHQSLAEATLPIDGETAEHYHPVAEEIYYFTAGTGMMRLGRDARPQPIGPGDAVVIPPGTPHKLWNTGPEPLTLLCCCAPAYSHDDTVMTGR